MGRPHYLCFAFLSPLIGCTTPTPAFVARLGADTFTRCQIEIGWWLSDLVRECGEPDRWVRGNHDDACAVYSTATQPLNEPPGAAAIVVCARNVAAGLSGEKLKNPPPSDIIRNPEYFEVHSVYGLRSTD